MESLTFFVFVSKEMPERPGVFLSKLLPVLRGYLKDFHYFCSVIWK